MTMPDSHQNPYKLCLIKCELDIKVQKTDYYFHLWIFNKSDWRIYTAGTDVRILSFGYN